MTTNEDKLTGILIKFSPAAEEKVRFLASAMLTAHCHYNADDLNRFFLFFLKYKEKTEKELIMMLNQLELQDESPPYVLGNLVRALCLFENENQEAIWEAAVGYLKRIDAKSCGRAAA